MSVMVKKTAVALVTFSPFHLITALR